MPKETFNSSVTHSDPRNSAKVKFEDLSTVLAVGWSKDPDTGQEICIRMGEGYADPSNGLAVYISSRKELNRLIRVLRTARDQSWGVDE